MPGQSGFESARGGEFLGAELPRALRALRACISGMPPVAFALGRRPEEAPSQPPSANQPQQTVAHQTEPEIYGQSPIDLEGLVLRERREEPLHAEVNGIPRQHRDQ